MCEKGRVKDESERGKFELTMSPRPSMANVLLSAKLEGVKEKKRRE